MREFTLPEFADGRSVVLCLYVSDFSPVCTTRMCEGDDMELPTFTDEAGGLGSSTEAPYSHTEFIEEHGLSYPLLTDDDRTVCEQYGMVERTDDGRRQSERGIVLVDGDPTVRYRWEAESNWAEWSVDPLAAANELVRGLVG